MRCLWYDHHSECLTESEEQNHLRREEQGPEKLDGLEKLCILTL